MAGRFTVNLSYTLLGNNAADCSFSNTNAISAAAEVRTFGRECDAKSYIQRMDELHTGLFFQPRFLSKQGQKYHILGKSQDGENFTDRCNYNVHRLWKVKNRKALGLTSVAIDIFSGMIDGLNSFHDNGYYHGNLLNGVMISHDDKVFVRNESTFNQRDLLGGIVKDLRVAFMVEDAMSRVRNYYSNQIDEPASLCLFYDLYNNNFMNY